jgi:hypothetical protein
MWPVMVSLRSSCRIKRCAAVLQSQGPGCPQLRLAKLPKAEFPAHIPLALPLPRVAIQIPKGENAASVHDGPPKDSNGAASDTCEYVKKQPRHLPTKPTAHHPGDGRGP